MKPETGNLKHETGDLLAWGFKRQVSEDRPQESGNSLGTRVAEMTALLREQRVIHAEAFEQRFGWSDRQCRQIAEASHGEIISTCEGYLLTVRATAEEFKQANSRIYSQGRKMLKRALREQRVWHKQVHA
jgi:hypothetical protein